MSPSTNDRPTNLGRGDGIRYAYDTLRARILAGDLPAGATLSQVQLADEMGVSRTPLREAVRLLEREGLVYAEPRRRMRVQDVSVEDLEQLFASRILLESFGVRISVPRLDDTSTAELRDDCVDLCKALDQHDHAAFIEPHRRFRTGLYARAGMRMVAELTELYEHSERYRGLFMRAASEQLALYELARADYTNMMDAADRRDGNAAAALVAGHLATTALSLIARMKLDHDPELIRAALFSSTGQDRSVP